MALFFLVLALGFGISVLSGWLGLGGGIILTPALMIAPPLAMAASLDMKTISGLTVVQALCAGISGAIGHRRSGSVDRRLIAWMGAAAAIASLAGSISSQWVSNELLMILFAGLALIASAMMLFFSADDRDSISPATYDFNRGIALALAASIGFLGGMVGQGGAFILIPLMLHILKVPIRVVIASSLAIVALSAATTFVGKVLAGQMQPTLAIAIAIGAIPGGLIGSTISLRTKPIWLHRILAVIIGGSAIYVASQAWQNCIPFN